MQAAHSCGDLLFSSHTTFLLNGALTYSVYGSHPAIKAAVWLAIACICCLIIASRKHYTGAHAVAGACSMQCGMHAWPAHQLHDTSVSLVLN